MLVYERCGHEGLMGAAQLLAHFDLELLRAAAPMLVRLS